MRPAPTGVVWSASMVSSSSRIVCDRIAAEVEIGMVGRVEEGRLVGRAAVVDAQGVRRASACRSRST